MTRLTDVVTVAQAAEIKGVSEVSVRSRINRGKLPAVKTADVWLIRRKDLDAWTVQRKKKPGELG